MGGNSDLPLSFALSDRKNSRSSAVYPTQAKTGLEWGTQLSLPTRVASRMDLPIQFTGTKGRRPPSPLSSRAKPKDLRCALPSNKGWVPHCRDFLWRLVALIHSMRLSLMKGAHADLSSTAWQEIGVKPGFGLSGTTALDLLFYSMDSG